ncbi:hypothetical protein [Halobacteriovorax sp. CON-3]|uniref:hypothetical protein n=1 Tax=Halobacteriovorax sp. CON-3 TaxID=3157710 RepID=UPI0037128160
MNLEISYTRPCKLMKEECISEYKKFVIQNEINLNSLTSYLGAPNGHFEFWKDKVISREVFHCVHRLLLGTRLKKREFPLFSLFEGKYLLHSRFPVFTGEIVSDKEALEKHPDKYILGLEGGESLVITDFHDHSSLVTGEHLNKTIANIEDFLGVRAKTLFTASNFRKRDSFDVEDYKYLIENKIMFEPFLGTTAFPLSSVDTFRWVTRIFPYSKHGIPMSPITSDKKVLSKVSQRFLFYYLASSIKDDYFSVTEAFTSKDLYINEDIILFNRFPRFVAKRVLSPNLCEGSLLEISGAFYDVEFFDNVGYSELQFQESAVGERLLSNLKDSIPKGKKSFRYNLEAIKEKLNCTLLTLEDIYNQLGKMIKKLDKSRGTSFFTIERDQDFANIRTTIKANDLEFTRYASVSYGNLPMDLWDQKPVTIFKHRVNVAISKALISKGVINGHKSIEKVHANGNEFFVNK